MQANFRRVSVGKICKKGACVYTQEVLAISPCVMTRALLTIQNEQQLGFRLHGQTAQN